MSAAALIIAINLPLALLFAFAVLYLRGQSANLLSIGAVDFGIIIDSTVILVENIYRVLSTGKYAELPLPQRIVRAASEIQRALFFSTLIMVCAMLPLFTMKGPEGQLFRPMAQTYAFAIGGALLLALTIAPVLCLLLFRHLKPTEDNFFVRFLKTGYLRNLERCLNHRGVVVAFFGFLMLATLACLPFLGREFMPALEEGHLWIRGIFPVSVSLQENAEGSRLARAIMRKYPEVELVVCQLGRPDSGVDPTGFYSAEFFVPLKPQEEWAAATPATGWRRLFGPLRRRTKPELIQEMSAELAEALPGVNWNFSQVIRDNVLEVLSGVQGENSVKILGPDLDELEQLGRKVAAALGEVPGVKDAGYYKIKGQSNLELAIDRAKCALWNISVANVHNVIQTAIGGKTVSQMIEGEKSFDITLRWPERLRRDETDILDIPVDVTGHLVIGGSDQNSNTTPFSGSSTSLSATGNRRALPSLAGSAKVGAPVETLTTPRERLGDLVTPQGDDPDSDLDPQGNFVHSGASTIAREQGTRLVAVKFGVRDRDLAGTVNDAQKRVKDLIPRGYRAEWSGEFQQMEEGERRLMFIIPLALGMVFILLYLAFHSLLDALVVLSNVVALSLGGIWALILTGTNFSIAAAVGFTSIFGVAIMDGLLLVSSFNQLRAARRAAAPSDYGRRRTPRQARHDDGLDRHLWPAASRGLGQGRSANPEAAGDRRRGQHGGNSLPHTLSDAGALQLLRQTRAPRIGRRPGSLASCTGRAGRGWNFRHKALLEIGLRIERQIGGTDNSLPLASSFLATPADKIRRSGKPCATATPSTRKQVGFGVRFGCNTRSRFGNKAPRRRSPLGQRRACYGSGCCWGPAAQSPLLPRSKSAPPTDQVPVDRSAQRPASGPTAVAVPDVGPTRLPPVQQASYNAPPPAPGTLPGSGFRGTRGKKCRVWSVRIKAYSSVD